MAEGTPHDGLPATRRDRAVRSREQPKLVPGRTGSSTAERRSRIARLTGRLQSRPTGRAMRRPGAYGRPDRLHASRDRHRTQEDHRCSISLRAMPPVVSRPASPSSRRSRSRPRRSPRTSPGPPVRTTSSGRPRGCHQRSRRQRRPRGAGRSRHHRRRPRKRPALRRRRARRPVRPGGRRRHPWGRGRTSSPAATAPTGCRAATGMTSSTGGAGCGHHLGRRRWRRHLRRSRSRHRLRRLGQRHHPRRRRPGRRRRPLRPRLGRRLPRPLRHRRQLVRAADPSPGTVTDPPGGHPDGRASARSGSPDRRLGRGPRRRPDRAVRVL